jgi:ABC-type uncharacterized transport system permease subunit
MEGMNKDRLVDLVFKGTALYLFARALFALSALVSNLLVLLALRSPVDVEPSLATSEPLEKLWEPMQRAMVAGAIRQTVMLVVCLLFARNLFNGGSWIRRILGGGESMAEQTDKPAERPGGGEEESP